MESNAAPSTSSTRARKLPAGAPACLCSPTTHPGSFRCKMHRGGAGRPSSRTTASTPEAKARSMRALLMQVIRPSSHDAGRRRDFQPKPSRFLLMNGSDVHGVPVN